MIGKSITPTNVFYHLKEKKPFEYHANLMLNEEYCVKSLGIKCTLSTLRKFWFSAVGINEEGPLARLKWYLFVCITNWFQQIFQNWLLLCHMNNWPVKHIRTQCNPSAPFPFKWTHNKFKFADIKIRIYNCNIPLIYLVNR